MRIFKSRKADVTLYLLILGLILGYTSYIYQSTKNQEENTYRLNTEILEQIVQRDLEINNIKSYLKKSGEFSLIDSVYKLAENSGYYLEPTCGFYKNIPLIQSEENSLEECFPNINEEVKHSFSNYFESYLLAYPEELLDISDYNFATSSKNSFKIISNANKEIIIPREEDIFSIDYKNKPFDEYKITLYAELACDELINSDYKIRIYDLFSTEGYKHIYADVMYPYNKESTPKDGSDLIYTSTYKSQNENDKVSTDFIGNEKGKYCMPLGLNEIHNLELTTYKDGKEVCTVTTSENNWESKESFEGYDIQTWDPKGDNNENNIIDKNCLSSPTYLECPGIRAYYCGKTGWKSFPRRSAEFPSWKSLSTGNGDIDDTFVNVYYSDEPEKERPFSPYIHAKTSAKFLVDISPEHTSKGTALKRDKWYKRFIQDQFEFLSTEEVKGKTPTYVYKSFRPSFYSTIDYDFSDYEYLKETLLKLNELCGLEKNTKNCIEDGLDKLNENTEGYKWSVLDSEEKNFIFEVTSKKQFFPYKNSLTYKFAAYIKPNSYSSITPIAKSRPGTYNSLLVFFDIPKEDVSSFDLYYSNGYSLNKINISQTQKEISKKTFIIPEIIELDTDPNECIFQNINSKCLPTLDPSKIYRYGDKYFLLLENLENQEYSLAITATDNENKLLSEILSSIEITPEDLLAPGKPTFTKVFNSQDATYTLTIAQPTKNIDGSEFSGDLQNYYIFASDSQGDLVNFKNLKAETTQTTATISAPENSIIGIIATDINNNPLTKLSATGESEGKMSIKPEYSSIINNLAIQ